MQRMKTKDLYIYIAFIIINILLPIPIYMLSIHTDSFPLFCVAGVLGITMMVLHYIILGFETKTSFFVSLFPILVTIACYLLGYDKAGGMYVMLVIIHFIFLCIKAKTYYHVFFTEGYVTDREKKDQEKERLAKEKEKEEEELNNSKYQEFKFSTSEKESSKKEVVKETKEDIVKDEKDIMFEDIPCKIYYPRDKNTPLRQLIFIGDEDNIVYDGDIGFEWIGSDDTSSIIFRIYDNHAFVENWVEHEMWYFDINDLVSYTLESEYCGLCMGNIILKFKDGTEKRFSDFGDDLDIKRFEEEVKPVNYDIKCIEKSLFDKGTKYSIQDNVLNVETLREDSNQEINIISIPLDNIKDKIINDHDVILIDNSDYIYELKAVDDDTLSILKNN